jgi:hypothetical protein
MISTEVVGIEIQYLIHFLTSLNVGELVYRDDFVASCHKTFLENLLSNERCYAQSSKGTESLAVCRRLEGFEQDFRALNLEDTLSRGEVGTEALSGYGSKCDSYVASEVKVEATEDIIAASEAKVEVLGAEMGSELEVDVEIQNCLSKVTITDAPALQEAQLAFDRAVESNDVCAVAEAMSKSVTVTTKRRALKLLCQPDKPTTISPEHNAILRFISLSLAQPDTAGRLRSYCPSKWLGQTFAKGWGLPDMKWCALNTMSWDGNCAGSVLNDALSRWNGLFEHIFSYFLDPVDSQLPALKCVCRLWNNGIRRLFGDHLSILKTQKEKRKWDSLNSCSASSIYNPGSDCGEVYPDYGEDYIDDVWVFFLETLAFRLYR